MRKKRKYEFTGEVDRCYSCTFRRIRALRDFGDVKKGDLGGWIESESNLSHEGNCWVYENCHVSGRKAKIYGNAKIKGNSSVKDSEVHGNAVFDGRVRVFPGCNIKDNAVLHSNATLQETYVADNVEISGYVWLRGCIVAGNTKLIGDKPWYEYNHAFLVDKC
jgi:NDP-sugar pyrophosphorylase family protein